MAVVLVTGGRGTIGSNVCLALARQGKKCISADVSETESPMIEIAEDSVKSRIVFEKLDATDFPRLCEIMKDYGVTGVINGAHVPPRADWNIRDYIFPAIKVGMIGLINLLELAREHHLPMVHFSSGSVYKERLDFENPMKENEPRSGNTLNHYYLQKFMQDLLIEYYQKVHNTDVRIARPSRVYGPPRGKFGANKLPPDLILPKVVQGETIIELPYAYQKSSEGTLRTPKILTELTYVRDVAEAAIKLYDIERADLKQSVYNIGGGRLYSIEEIIETTRKLFPDRTIEFKMGQETEFTRNIRPPVDISAARRDLNYEPTSLESAFNEYAAWLKTFYQKQNKK